MTGRGPGWPTVLALTLAVLTFSVVHPVPLVLIPLALLLVALPPRNPRTLALALVLGTLAFLGPHGPLWSVERGWSLLLGAWFVLAVAIWPSAAFVNRALAAVAGSLVSAALVILTMGGWAELDWTVATHYSGVAEAMGRSWPRGSGVDAAAVVQQAAELPARLFPSIAAVGSIAALALAWWLYRRLARRGEPLGRLTEFRFPDGMVWVLIAGLALLILPAADWGGRVGANLVLFMGALYALRGLAVIAALIVAMVGTHVPALVALGLVGVLLYPIVVAGTLLLGVTDTWLDLRSGRRAANDEG